MSEDAPTIKLVNAILLSAWKKQASGFRIYRDGERAVLEFRIAGVVQQQAAPPVALVPVIVRRLAIMASLPTYAKGEAVSGYIHLLIGDDQHAYFDVWVEGHGADMKARIRCIKADEMPPASP